VRFDIGGMQNDSRITSLRKVDWGSLHANFFVMYTVATLPGVPLTFMGAFRAPRQEWLRQRAGAQLPQRHQCRHERHHQSGAARARPGDPRGGIPVRLHAGGGLVVLFAAVTATREERAREFAVMRAVGARASLLRQVQRAELVGVGLLAGLPGEHRGLGHWLGSGPLCVRVHLDRIAAGALGGRWPAHCWR
jgi:putative ABC transport system permease protein